MLKNVLKTDINYNKESIICKKYKIVIWRFISNLVKFIAPPRFFKIRFFVEN